MTTATKALNPFRSWTSSGNQEAPTTLRAAIVRSDEIARADRTARIVKAAHHTMQIIHNAALPREEDIALVEAWLPATEDLLAAIWDNEEDAIYDAM